AVGTGSECCSGPEASSRHRANPINLREHMNTPYFGHSSHRALIFVAVLFTSACGSSEPKSQGAAGQPAPPAPAAFSQTDLVNGTGAQAGPGARVTVKYTGWIYDASRRRARARSSTAPTIT